MRLISSNVLKEGMVVARTIWNEAGHPLLQKDAVITLHIIERLKQLNIQYIYINDEISNGIEIEETVSPEVRKKVIGHITQSFKEIRSTSNGRGTAYILDRQSKVIGELVEDLLKSLLDSNEILTILSDAYLVDEYLYQHSFQVTLYSLAIAKEMGYPYEAIRTIGVGAILHDIGKMLISPEILFKPGPLTDDEFAEIKMHTQHGFDILRNVHSVSLLVAHCAFQHHERNNGSGYPRGLMDKEIHPYAKIIGVADVFDAITSNRVYRKKMIPSEGYKIIEEGKGILYDVAVVEALKKSVIHYPNGTVIRLSDQSRGIVTRQNQNDPTLPWLRIFEKNSQILGATFEISLAAPDAPLIEEVELDFVLNER